MIASFELMTLSTQTKHCVAFVALALLASCIQHERTLSEEPAASPQSSKAQTPTTQAASTPSMAQLSDEELLNAFELLVREHTTTAELEAFIKEHPSIINKERRPYGTALMWALEFEEEDAALALLHAGASAPKEALALAARGGLDVFIQELLAQGASPDLANDWGNTPLHMAAQYGHVSTIKLLLAAKAAPSPKDTNDGFTPLHLAVMERQIPAIKALLAAGAELEARDQQGRTPLSWGPFAYIPQELHLYKKMGGPHDTLYKDPGPAEGMLLLLDAGARIEARDDEGNTPLIEAAQLNSLRGAEALMARGANIKAKNRAGETPLSIAKKRKSEEMVRLLTP